MLPIITFHIYDSVSASEPYVYDHSNKLNVKAKIRLQTVSLTVQSRLLFSINSRLKLYVINFEIQLIPKSPKPSVFAFLGQGQGFTDKDVDRTGQNFEKAWRVTEISDRDLRLPGCR